MNIYCVKVTRETVVAAGSDREAERLAGELDLSDHKPKAVAFKIYRESQLPPPWITNCHPFGDEAHTINHYLKSSL